MVAPHLCDARAIVGLLVAPTRSMSAVAPSAITLRSITRCSAGVKALRVLAVSSDRAFRPAFGLDAACAPRGPGTCMMAMAAAVVRRGQLLAEILVQPARFDA
jgi:hypothetical protein